MAKPRWIPVDYDAIHKQVLARLDDADTGFVKPLLKDFCEAVDISYRQYNRIKAGKRAPKELLKKLYKAWIVLPENIIDIIEEKYKDTLLNRLQNPLQIKTEK